MGRYIEQTDSRSQLQQRIAADLRAKAAAKAKQEGGGDPSGNPVDGVEGAAYVEGTKATTPLAPIWALIFFMAIGVFAFFVYQVNR